MADNKFENDLCGCQYLLYEVTEENVGKFRPSSFVLVNILKKTETGPVIIF